jgi:ankyrin repeat protein
MEDHWLERTLPFLGVDDTFVSAISVRKTDAVRTMIESKVNVNPADNSPLHTAVRSQNAEITELLLDAKAHIEWDSTTAWDVINTCDDRNLALVNVLLKRGAGTCLRERRLDGTTICHILGEEHEKLGRQPFAR